MTEAPPTAPSRPYRVLVTTWQDFGAGSIQSVQYLSEGLLARGHDVTVACPVDGVLGRRLVASGVPVVSFDFPRGWSLGAARRLRDLIQAKDIELVDAQESRDRKAAILARTLFGASGKLIITRRQMTATVRPLNRLYGRVADRVVAISRGVADDLRVHGMAGADIRVVHTGLDLKRVANRPSPEAIAALRSSLRIDPELPTVGVMARRKDQESLLKAAASLRRPLNLLLVGIERDEPLRALEPALPEGTRTVYTGFVPNVLPYYELLDVMVLTTLREGLSQAILESMALGVPVVTAAVGGTPEVVEHEVSGLHYAPGDAEDLAQQLGRILGDPMLADRLVEGGSQRLHGHFTADHFVTRTEAVYRELLEGGSAPVH